MKDEHTCNICGRPVDINNREELGTMAMLFSLYRNNCATFSNVSFCKYCAKSIVLPVLQEANEKMKLNIQYNLLNPEVDDR